MRILLETPPGFSYRNTVHGHGWLTLDPFSVDDKCSELKTAATLPGLGTWELSLQPAEQGVLLRLPGRPRAAARRRLEAIARRMLGLDLDLSAFYALAAGDDQWDWLARLGAGRLLRCPTAFEDLVKLILTTNCSWALTQRMISNLIEHSGEKSPAGRRAFPTAAALARLNERTLRERIKLGYRAPLLANLVRRVARGELDPERWDDPSMDLLEMKSEMLAQPGVGPYVAENLLRMQGRPDGLACDSWLRTRYAELHHRGRRVTDRAIARRYARFGRWAGLAFWCEMTREWLAE